MSKLSKQEVLLEELSRIEPRIRAYKNLTGPGMERKVKRLIFLGPKYVRTSLGKAGASLGRDIKARTFFGRRIFLSAEDMTTYLMYYFGTLRHAELPLIRYFIRVLKPDDVFFDIGASYGFFTLLARELISEGEVHAFEPIPRVFGYLKQSVGNNDGVFLNNVAVCNQKGTLPFNETVQSSGKSTLLGDLLDERERTTSRVRYRPIKVPTTTLDDYTKKHNVPTVIKLDVEGAEEQVIVGGKDLLRKNSPTIALEVGGLDKHAARSARAVSALQKLGFELHKIMPDGEIQPSGIKEVQKDSEKYYGESVNAVLVRK